MYARIQPGELNARNLTFLCHPHPSHLASATQPKHRPNLRQFRVLGYMIESQYEKPKQYTFPQIYQSYRHVLQ